jgi:SAM-dependent methyltransferase
VQVSKNTYNRYAQRYVALIEEDSKKEFSLYHSFIVPMLLEFAGDVRNVAVLDAGCGAGHVSRLLCQRGASVVGIDVSARLIDFARSQSEGLPIEYAARDLSRPLPAKYREVFDLVVCNLAIDDVPDYTRFIANIGRSLRADGRAVLTMNNPYSAVIRSKVENYFDTEKKAVLYHGMSSKGVKVYYFHRTLEEYMVAFQRSGFSLSRLSDMKPPVGFENEKLGIDKERYGRYYHFPFFILLEFTKVVYPSRKD